ncbi:DUF6233 domain-containing protein [Streptomyces sp. NPDC057854]|uniref:DUF6233 domain-containing protein n=1 Tax=unclassified Streptomyces TaxID=2593676 RepID=UPI00368D5E7F
MNDLPPDLPRLQTLETWLELQLHRVRAEISRQEQQRAAATARPPRQPAPFVLSFLRAGGRPVPDSVHTGDCRMTSSHTRPLTREEALRVLAGGGPTACAICRPDTELGLLD